MVSTGSISESSDQRADSLDLSNASYLGRLAERLSALIEEQTAEVFDRHGIIIPVRSCALLETISKLGSASAADLSTALGQSHQLIAQKTPKLMKLRLISQSKDARDARRKVFKVTKRGQDQLRLLSDCSVLIKEAYAALFTEVGDVAAVLIQASSALEEKPIMERIDAL